MVERLNISKTAEQGIIQHILSSDQQRITFAEYMEMALYHPQFGYYSTRDRTLGAQGDFVTSPHMGRDFGELIAAQFVDMWKALGRPQPFNIVEIGAGQGLIAADVIAYLHTHHPDCFTGLSYTIIEKSAQLRAEQQARLSTWADQGVSLSWTTIAALPNHALTGCIFSNELVDALPVHWVEQHDQQLQEMWVVAAEQRIAPQLGALSTPELATYFDKVHIDLRTGYPEGYRTEVNLAALDWLEQVAQKIERGYLLTIDYGYTAQRHYSPARKAGTLQCYYRHSHHNDPFIHIGEQDITAHVDFTALENQGHAVGLETIGFTQQALFLMALGLGDRLSALSQPAFQHAAEQPATTQTIRAIMQRREILQQLISPMGLGGFGVLIQAKGLSQKEIARPLKGLTIPAMF
ncbi:MAG: SAM-dependent methyltransferase [Cyanobacteria bacterium J06623_5]